MKRHCPQGHPYKGKNLGWVKTKGRAYPSCRTCKSERWRLKYRTDPAFRLKKQQSALARYHRRKHGLLDTQL